MMKQPGDSSLEGARSAIIRRAAGAGARPRRIVLDVIDHDQIEPAIPIEVEKSRRGRPSGIVQTRLLGCIQEAAIALIEKELDALVLGYDDIGPAIVVDIADGHPHVMPRDVQPRAFADILKTAIGQLLI